MPRILEATTVNADISSIVKFMANQRIRLLVLITNMTMLAVVYDAH
jgi:hypothetical protein